MRKKVALVTGGYSGENVISYKTAETIMNNLDRERWDPYYIDIRNDGWFHKKEDGREVAVDKNDFSVLIDDARITFDAVLISLHGTPGEDGKLQGYFDCINLPYTSCNAATSALTFNKRYTVAVAAFAGIDIAKSVHLFKHGKADGREAAALLRYPVFVKPNNGGSSLGMSKVATPSDLQPALDKAFAVDEQVLVEEAIEGREFTIGVYRKNSEIITLPMTEILSENEFFDYAAKYEGASREITPAEADKSTAEAVAAAAKKIYAVFNCNGVVRIDFIWDASVNRPFMLEINTVPGQSAASIVPQQVVAAGGTLKEFYSGLLDECLRR